MFTCQQKQILRNFQAQSLWTPAVIYFYLWPLCHFPKKPVNVKYVNAHAAVTKVSH